MLLSLDEARYNLDNWQNGKMATLGTAKFTCVWDIDASKVTR